MEREIINVEACDYDSWPRGGQLEFCKMLVRTGMLKFLVGLTSLSDGLSHWREIDIQGQRVHFYGLYAPVIKLRPKIPIRLRTLISLLFINRNTLGTTDDKILLAHSPEAIIALHLRRDLKFYARIYFSHGARNPLDDPRYAWGKLFRHLFQHLLNSSLKHCDLVLVAASSEDIAKLRSSLPAARRFTQFPMRFDDSIFYPQPAKPRPTQSPTTIVAVGRINRVKGWSLLLSALHALNGRNSSDHIQLRFVGGGEDEAALHRTAEELRVSRHIHVTGFLQPEEVAREIHSADLVVSGSLHEGWPISILEALACGRNVVSTRVSGASDMIVPGVTGYIVDGRNPLDYANAVDLALKSLPRDNPTAALSVASFKASGLEAAFKAAISDTAGSMR